MDARPGSASAARPKASTGTPSARVIPADAGTPQDIAGLAIFPVFARRRVRGRPDHRLRRRHRRRVLNGACSLSGAFSTLRQRHKENGRRGCAMAFRRRADIGRARRGDQWRRSFRAVERSADRGTARRAERVWRHLFRDQKLTPEQHIAFAERFGPIDINRFSRRPGYPQIAEVRKEPEQKVNIGGGWHTDTATTRFRRSAPSCWSRETPRAAIRCSPA